MRSTKAVDGIKMPPPSNERNHPPSRASKSRQVSAASAPRRLSTAAALLLALASHAPRYCCSLPATTPDQRTPRFGRDFNLHKPSARTTRCATSKVPEEDDLHLSGRRNAGSCIRTIANLTSLMRKFWMTSRHKPPQQLGQLPSAGSILGFVWRRCCSPDPALGRPSRTRIRRAGSTRW